jgi:serine/threonine protein kinase
VYSGRALPEDRLPLLDVTFAPSLTISGLCAQIAASFCAPESHICVFDATGALSPLPGDASVSRFCSDPRIPLLFTASTPDCAPSVEGREWLTDFGRFGFRRHIARGSYAEVFEARDPKTRETIALKVATFRIADAELADFEYTKTFREVAMLILFSHPCILSICGWGLRDDRVVIGTEWLSGGALAGALGKLDPTECAIVAVGVALGMRHIHARGALHRDLKPGNVLLDARNAPQIADLGACRDLDLNMSVRDVGTLRYMAPELFSVVYRGEDGSYGQPVDVFAFALILYELIVKEVAFEGNTVCEIGPRLTSGSRPNLGAEFPEASKRVIERGWSVDPGARMTFPQIVDAFRDAGYCIVPGADCGKVIEYVREIEELEKTCFLTPVGSAWTE